MVSDSLNSSDLIAITSVAIALIALAATFWQAHITRKHNRLSVKPIIQHIIESYPDGHLSLSLVNVGLGPAIIDKIEFIDKISTIAINTEQLVDKLIIAMTNTNGNWSQTNFIGNTALEPGKVSEVFKLDLKPEHQEDYKILQNILDHTDLIVKYKCIYGNKKQYVTCLNVS